MSRLVFLSYATGAFSSARDALCESALRVGFDEAIACGEQDLDREFVRKNAAILSEKRGGGYWIWKPQIILQTLAKLSPGDILVYSDAGRSPYYQFRKRPDLLIAKARAQGLLTGVAIAQHGPLSKWTKRDAFKRLRLDRPEIHASAVVQATWSFWTPTQAAFSFLEAWREVCEDAACITDQPNVEGAENLPDFQDHRHDQSLSSLLTHARNAPISRLFQNAFVQNPRATAAKPDRTSLPQTDRGCRGDGTWRDDPRLGARVFVIEGGQGLSATMQQSQKNWKRHSMQIVEKKFLLMLLFITIMFDFKRGEGDTESKSVVILGVANMIIGFYMIARTIQLRNSVLYVALPFLSFF